jgi:deoxyhypusine synthase
MARGKKKIKAACPHQAEHDRWLAGRRIWPGALTGRETAARLSEAAHLGASKMLEPAVTGALSVAGALTPAGLGPSCLIPLIEHGFVDWIVSTGANLYHDLHFALNCKLVAGDYKVDDAVLHEVGVVRIYDILLSRDDCLIRTDEFVRETLSKPEFQKTLTTAEMHYRLGRYAAQVEQEAGLPHVSVLAAAYRAGVPIYTSSPGDSTFGMELGAMRLGGARLALDPIQDVNETAAFYFDAKDSGRKSAVVLLGGGSPKNFVLQTAPYVTDSLGIELKGHDYFLQVTDARVDTGGLSGATPSEAVSWGMVDPERIPDAVVCYLDTTVALPLLVSYALARHAKRPLKRLYDHREELTARLQKAAVERGTRKSK